MTPDEALKALGTGLAASDMTAEEITAMAKEAGRGLKMLKAIGLRAEAAATQKTAANLNDQATALEQAAQQS